MNLFKQVALQVKQTLFSLYSGSGMAGGLGGFWGLIREPFSGAWQKNIIPESCQNLLAFAAVYASVSLIANDISKLRLKLIQQTSGGTWVEVVDPTSPFLAVLAKPNRYQTRLQFISYWLVMKLLYGNTYVLKERDRRGVVTDLYIIDSRWVTPLIGLDGSVWYRIRHDYLTANVTPDDLSSPTVPASEIIHDRMPCLWHPLIGVTPIYACGASATMGLRIQANSEKFFENMSRPSGQLTSPDVISDDTIAALKKQFEENFQGSNIGRLLVTGNGLTYTPMSMPATDAQLIDQLRWTVSDVARAFLIPEYKIATAASGRAPAANLAELNQDYYNQTLQTHIESIELLLDEGLNLPAKYQIEMDLDGLLRMDPLSQIEGFTKAIAGALMAPNEGRARVNLGKVPGGDSVYMQQQNYSLEALVKRDAAADPFATSSSPQPEPVTPALPAPKSIDDEAMAKIMTEVANVSEALKNVPVPEKVDYERIEKALLTLPEPEKVDYERIAEMVKQSEQIEPQSELDIANKFANEMLARFLEVTCE